jgi:hypothetical protein
MISSNSTNNDLVSFGFFSFVSDIESIKVASGGVSSDVTRCVVVVDFEGKSERYIAVK